MIWFYAFLQRQNNGLASFGSRYNNYGNIATTENPINKDLKSLCTSYSFNFHEGSPETFEVF